MSRRRGFETSLTSSSSRTNGRGVNSQPAPPAISTPNAEEPTAVVPTGSNESSEEGQIATTETTPEEELDDESTCFICAEPITFWSTGVCRHKTCHICALRLRIFYKKTDCTYCKTVQPSLYFSRSPNTPFPEDHRIKPSPAHLIAAAQANADKLEKGERWDKGLVLPGKLDLTEFEWKDDKLSVAFEDKDMMEATLLLLRFNCPHPDCAHMSDSWHHLQKHTISIHGLSLCTVCCQALSRFAHEQVLYPPHLLGLHDPSRLQRGQRPPRPKGREIELVKSWDAPHPICEFCHQAFFSPDELFAHMRSKHDECFVCKNLGERNVYFQNYAKLEAHFNTDHFPCRQPACLEQKFVVFGSELDLRAHMIEEHKGAMSAREQAQSRQINVDFNNDQSHRAGSSSRAGQGRGFSIQQRDSPHGQQLSAAAPMGPAQAAQARRQAQADRHEEGNRRRKTFNTNLTDTHREPEDENLGSGFNTPREDVDEATAMRHAALLSRVSLMVSDSNTKMSSFRSAIRAFKMTESTAQNMIDTIYNVLDRDAQATISVTKEIGQIFEEDGDRDKARNILEAMNGFRAQQEQQYPSLGGPSGLGSNYAGITSGQVLRAKNTTHTSGRSTNSRNVWDRVAAAAASDQPRAAPANQRYPPGSRAALASPSSFPTLAQTPTANGRLIAGSSAHSTPWASGGAGSTSKAPSALAPQISRPTPTSTNFPQPKKTNSKPPSQAAFPSLPTSAKASISAQERKALFSKPNARQETIRRITGTGSGSNTPLNSQGWGSGSGTGGGGGGLNGTSEAVEALSLRSDEQSRQQGQGQEQGGGRKKGKQKQILFSVSARPQ